MQNSNVFVITFRDFEIILGRELTEDEKLTIHNKFTIEPWVEYVETFLDVYNIKQEVNNDL
jgi:hypothetical protein